jgi:hypothetical protein
MMMGGPATPFNLTSTRWMEAVGGRNSDLVASRQYIGTQYRMRRDATVEGLSERATPNDPPETTGKGAVGKHDEGIRRPRTDTGLVEAGVRALGGEKMERFPPHPLLETRSLPPPHTTGELGWMVRRSANERTTLDSPSECILTRRAQKKIKGGYFLLYPIPTEQEQEELEEERVIVE